MSEITIKTIYNELARIDPQLKIGDESFKAAVVLLSALAVGTDVNALHDFTGINKATIKKFSANLTKNGVWKHGKTLADWFDGKNGEGTIAFFMDVNVALGFMARKPAAA